ncbi:BRCA1-associated RING domain protein 1 [Collichthys lucidus]|uniref:BRCA1-associated RING domain protein 1 n=1 Tax=Collichthys lucidus TaxID=240159 RepID=A0A4U5U0I3_COLLU|nr:BRCA1-associated RING domain protein 1 [Collichthys lucidus]
MDNEVLVQTSEWKNTKEAVANFRRLLLCSKWSCAGPRAGDGCVVCNSPAWVKDIQINRQLSSIIQLFSGLESLLNPREQPDSSLAEIQTQPQSPVFKNKKNFKIWFSPRSRKVRCVVDKPSEVIVPENRCKNEKTNGKRSTKKNAASKKALVQNTTRTTRKKTEHKMKKNRLEAINQQWGITEEVSALKGKEDSCAEDTRRSSKRVSFLSPAVTSEEPQPKVPQGSTNGLSPGRSTLRESLSRSSPVLNDQTLPGQSVSDSVVRHDKLSTDGTSPTDNPEKQDKVSPPKHSSKRSRVEEKVSTLETTPKRPRVSPGRRRRSQMSPAVLSSSSMASPRCDKTIKKQQGDSPSVLATVGRKSPSSPRSPAVMKRNHKGETLLHLAAIKGDVEAVKELLDQGVDPNLKDNAGWTPLHEACNLGHLAVVEVLVSSGALLNTPGYKNDSPLHDAVRNGHTAIVKVLLQHGASQHVLNLHGKRPADYAVSVEMLEIFQEASKGTQYADTSLDPSGSFSAMSDCAKRDEMVVFLASKLSQTEQHQLAKLGELLGGRIADTFSGSVSHVVLPEGQMPTTYSTLLGLLAGCWLVKFSYEYFAKNFAILSQSFPASFNQVNKLIFRGRLLSGSSRRSSMAVSSSSLAPSRGPPKDELIRLLREGGGQLLSRQPKPDSDVTQTLNAAADHALPGSDQALCTQYIIFDHQGRHKPAVVRRGKVWSAPSTWIINCIAAFRLLPVPDPQTLV